MLRFGSLFSRTLNVQSTFNQFEKSRNSWQQLVSKGSFCNLNTRKLHWHRPPGPLNVWKVVDGREKLADGLEKPVKLAIQEIPNDDQRKNEVYNFMVTHFLSEEPLCKSTNVKDDPDGVDCWMSLWKYGMDQEVSAGCYKLDSRGNIEDLVGVMMMYIETKESVEHFKKINRNCKSKSYKKILTLRDRLGANVDIFEKLQVDKYLVLQSTTVNPAYRGLHLGNHIVDAVHVLCKKYGVSALKSICSTESTQHYARINHFEELASIDFAELVIGDQQNPLFPNIKTKSANLVVKKLH